MKKVNFTKTFHILKFILLRPYLFKRLKCFENFILQVEKEMMLS